MLYIHTRSAIRSLLLIDGMFGPLFQKGSEVCNSAISLGLVYNQLKLAYSFLDTEMDTNSDDKVVIDAVVRLILMVIIKLMINEKSQLGLELLQMSDISKMPNLNDFGKLKSELSAFWLNSGLDKDDAMLAETFIKYLKQNGKKCELQTLIKLGADERDCSFPITQVALYKEAEDHCMRSTLRARKDTLQWLSARVIAKNDLSIKDVIKEAQDFVNAAKTFPGLENKPEGKRRRWTPMGIM